MTKARDLANAASALSAVSATELGYVDGVTSAIQTQIDGKQAVNANVSTTELGYLDGVTSAIQTQIDTKLASSTAATTYQAINANVSTTELGYLDGVTSAIQTQLNQKPEYVAGKNKIINGDFGIWQRGTSFTNPSAGSYLADRFGCGFDGSGATRVFSQQTFTPGTAPVAGYEGQYYLRLNQTVAGTGGSYNLITQPIEDVRTFAGQTITISFWAKAAANYTFAQVDMYQYFGSGGSTAVTIAGTSSDANVTTSWKRFVYNVTVPSISAKTVGSGSYIQLRMWLPTNTTFTFDIWGVQVETGSVATPFSLATGTIATELVACQRYYQIYGDTIYEVMDGGYLVNANVAYKSWLLPVIMRTTPTGTVVGSWAVGGAGQPTLQASQQRGFSMRITSVATGAYYFHSNTTYYLTFSAEL
jgi:hypothetical protein